MRGFIERRWEVCSTPAETAPAGPASCLENGEVLAGPSGFTVLARFEAGKIFVGSSGYTVLGRVEGLKVYRGSSGYDVACRGEGTGGLSLALAAAALCL